MEDHERWALLEQSEAHQAIRESERKGSGTAISAANADYSAPHRVHINKSLLREIADNAREQGWSPRVKILEKTGIPINTVDLATTVHDYEIRAMPSGPLRETFEALAILLGEEVPLATREWLVDPQLHPSMLSWYTALETYVRRHADKPGKRGDKGWDQAPGYDGRDDDEEAIDKFWVIPDAICLWTGKPGLELLRLEEMNSMYWDLMRDQSVQMHAATREPRNPYHRYPGGWTPPKKPQWSPALMPWKTLKADCEWWMRLDRPTCQQWNMKLGKAEGAEKHLTGGMRTFQHICVGHRKPVIVKNKAPVWTCPKCKGPMHAESWDKMAGILRRNRGNQWERMEQAMSTLDWLREMATEERRTNYALMEANPDHKPVWVFTSIYSSTIKKWLGNTWCLEMERGVPDGLTGTTIEGGYYREVRVWNKATPTTEAQRAAMRRKKKRIVQATYERIEIVMSQHDRAMRKIRKTFSRRMNNDLGIAWLPKWAAGELAAPITQHVIHIAEKFGHSAELFNPMANSGETLTWAIKCYFGWSEREAFRGRAGPPLVEHTGYGWNTSLDDPEEGQQRHDDTGLHQVFHDGYWVDFDEYRQHVPAPDSPWEDDEHDSEA